MDEGDGMTVRRPEWRSNSKCAHLQYHRKFMLHIIVTILLKRFLEELDLRVTSSRKDTKNMSHSIKGEWKASQ